jgi:glycosyltransferase involved in cell wall biosynthesis
MKILILSYYYPPCVGIAPNRPAAFAQNFSTDNEVKVITRHWTGNENSWTDYLISNDTPRQTEQVNKNLEIIRLPYQEKLRKNNSVRTLWDAFSGKADSEIDSMQFLSEASELITHWKPDMLLVSSPPLNIVTLAARLSTLHDIPFVADFRDFENHIILNTQKTSSAKERLLFHLKSKHIVKKLQRSSGLTAVNKEIIGYFQKEVKKPSELIFNGFERDLFKQFIPVEELKLATFTISIIGTVYPNQDLNIFLDAFRQVLQTIPDAKICFQFIGTNSIPETGSRIKEVLPADKILLTDRIPRREAIRYMEQSHLLWQPEMKGYTGMYTGKIFEYLGAKRTILVAPSLGDVLDRLLEETKAGKSFHSSAEISAYIIRKYRKWEENGFIRYEGNDASISFYSREKQSERLLDFIQSVVKKN